MVRSFEELESLVDPTVPSPGPTVPAGHPFNIPFLVITPNVWSATTYPLNTSQEWIVTFSDGTPLPSDKMFYWNVWCVRGAVGHDAH